MMQYCWISAHDPKLNEYAQSGWRVVPGILIQPKGLGSDGQILLQQEETIKL